MLAYALMPHVRAILLWTLFAAVLVLLVWGLPQWSFVVGRQAVSPERALVLYQRVRRP